MCSSLISKSIISKSIISESIISGLTADASLRRAIANPDFSISFATSSKRSGCLGTIISKVLANKGLDRICCCHDNTLSSSPLCVLAATQIGRPATPKSSTSLPISTSWAPLLSLSLGVLITHFSEPATRICAL